MKQISIITPVFNGESRLLRYFNAIRAVDYPLDKFEIVFVNDGSTDETQKILEKIKSENKNHNINIIKFEQNQGLGIAREQGVLAAKYDYIVFLDSQCEIDSEALKVISNLNEEAINSTVLQTGDSIYDRLLFGMRKRIYKSDPKENDIYITEKNFDEVSKGGSCFACTKKLFLESQIENKENKNSSDDIKLLWNIVQKHKILKTRLLKVTYHTRATLRENLRHLFNRGPKFVDYYLNPKKRYFIPIVASSIIGISILIGIIIGLIELKWLILLLIIVDASVILYIGTSIKDSILFFLLIPIFGLTFWTGIMKGIYIKLLKKPL